MVKSRTAWTADEQAVPSIIIFIYSLLRNDYYTHNSMCVRQNRSKFIEYDESLRARGHEQCSYLARRWNKILCC